MTKRKTDFFVRTEDYKLLNTEKKLGCTVGRAIEMTGFLMYFKL